MPFNIRNWYWIVNSDETRVYSSAAGDYVPASNPTYVAWKAGGETPTRITSETELGGVLVAPRMRPTSVGVLDAYLDKQSSDLIDATQFKILFNHENRLRAIERALSLNGSPPNLTAGQARAAVKALL